MKLRNKYLNFAQSSKSPNIILSLILNHLLQLNSVSTAKMFKTPMALAIYERTLARWGSYTSGISDFN